jgi:hypothetical protein
MVPLDHPEATAIDVTFLAHQLRYVRVANVLLFHYGFITLIALLVELVTRKLEPSTLLLGSPLIAPVFFAAIVAFQNIDVLSAVVRPLTRISLFLMSAMPGSVALLYLCSGELKRIFTGGPNAEDYQTVWLIFQMGLGGLAAFLSLVSVTRLRRSLLVRLGITLQDLLTYMRYHGQSEDGRPRVPVRSFTLGIAYVLLGVTASTCIVLFGKESSFHPMQALVWQLPSFFLIIARYHFQPSPERLIDTDRRKPIVFLRAFVDDENVNKTEADSALLDFSLESRLGLHFNSIGPFVAVGAPGDRSIRIGAARMSFSSNDWQEAVIRWIKEAQLVVLVAGVTRWLLWELGYIIDQGYQSKLILIFPQVQGSTDFKKDAAERLARVREAFALTSWAEPLGALAYPEQIRALRFESNGQLFMVTSRTRSRDSYHLGVLISHYLTVRDEEVEPHLPGVTTTGVPRDEP